MYVRVHKIADRKIVAICDEELIGKKFEEAGLQLDITKRFYKGKKMDDKEALKTMEDANSINIVGKKSIDFALKNGIISKKV